MAQTLSNDAQTLSYDETGDGSAVVILHGIGGHKEDWAAVAAALAPRHRVFAVDMLGFGGSSKRGERITIDDQVAAVVALLDAHGVRTADLIGNSVGGWVAATFAAQHPDRTGKLVLVDAAGFRAMFDGAPPVEFYPDDEAAMAKLLSYVRADPRTQTPAFVRAALAAAHASGDAAAAGAVGRGMVVSTRLEDVLDAVTAPALVLWGADDKLFPPAIADLVCAHLKGARKELIPAASHFPQLDNPSAFTAVVAGFLDG